MASETELTGMIAPGCSGYYHLPPVWVGEIPADEELLRGQAADLIRDVYRVTMSTGIVARVRRDGLFVFDCTRWDPGTETAIPAYATPGGGGESGRIVSRAHRQAAGRAAARIQLMNAHQACLSTSRFALHRCLREPGRMVFPSRMIHLASFEQNAIGGLSPNDPYHRYISELLTSTSRGRIRELPERDLLELDTVEHSFVLLDRALKSHSHTILGVFDLIYRAACVFNECRFSETLILSWAVCELLINESWTAYLKANECGSDGTQRINKSRREKLNGRDFPVSVVLEVLELAGRIPSNLHKEIDEIRRLRNGWLHSLKEITQEDAARALGRTESLLKFVTGIEVKLGLTCVGGYICVPDRARLE